MKRLNCNEVSELIPLYLADSVMTDHTDFISHIVSCPVCRNELKRQAQLIKTLNIYFSSMPEPPEHILDSIHRSITPVQREFQADSDAVSVLLSNISAMVRHISLIADPAYWLSGLKRFPISS